MLWWCRGIGLGIVLKLMRFIVKEVKIKYLFWGWCILKMSVCFCVLKIWVVFIFIVVCFIFFLKIVCVILFGDNKFIRFVGYWFFEIYLFL